MPQLNTPVNVSPLPVQIDADSVVVSLGSCFADEIGQRMLQGGFNVDVNPFGTLYNPASVAAALERLIEDREVGEDDLVQHEGLYHSWHHHGSFSRPTVEETLEACNNRIHAAHSLLLKADVLLVTFGTAWVFERKMESVERSVVANCHKLPASTFERRRMSVGEIVELWRPLIQKLSAANHQLSTIFTVSPIRHMADGAHGNQLSKSTLLLAIDQLLSILDSQFPISYFPAYEIVLDELRDYRFYAADMVHPSPLAADIVYSRFQQATMSPATIQQVHNNAKQAKRAGHVPLH